MDKIEFLEKIQLHDCTLLQICIEFVDKTIQFKINIYDDLKDDHVHTTLKFFQVSKLAISELEAWMDEDSHVEIYKNKFTKDVEYTMYFELLLGFGKPDARIQFCFKDYEVSGDLPQIRTQQNK